MKTAPSPVSPPFIGNRVFLLLLHTGKNCLPGKFFLS